MNQVQVARTEAIRGKIDWLQNYVKDCILPLQNNLDASQGFIQNEVNQAHDQLVYFKLLLHYMAKSQARMDEAITHAEYERRIDLAKHIDGLSVEHASFTVLGSVEFDKLQDNVLYVCHKTRKNIIDFVDLFFDINAEMPGFKAIETYNTLLVFNQQYVLVNSCYRRVIAKMSSGKLSGCHNCKTQAGRFYFDSHNNQMCRSCCHKRHIKAVSESFYVAPRTPTRRSLVSV